MNLQHLENALRNKCTLSMHFSPTLGFVVKVLENKPDSEYWILRAYGEGITISDALKNADYHCATGYIGTTNEWMRESRSKILTHLHNLMYDKGVFSATYNEKSMFIVAVQQIHRIPPAEVVHQALQDNKAIDYTCCNFLFRFEPTNPTSGRNTTLACARHIISRNLEKSTQHIGFNVGCGASLLEAIEKAVGAPQIAKEMEPTK